MMSKIKSVFMAALLSFAACAQISTVPDERGLKSYSMQDFVEEGVFSLEDADALISYSAGMDTTGGKDAFTGKIYHEWGLDETYYPFTDFRLAGEKAEMAIDSGRVILIYIEDGVIASAFFIPGEGSEVLTHVAEDDGRYTNDFVYLRMSFDHSTQLLNSTAKIDWESRTELDPAVSAEYWTTASNYVITSAHLNQWMFDFGRETAIAVTSGKDIWYNPFGFDYEGFDDEYLHASGKFY